MAVSVEYLNHVKTMWQKHARDLILKTLRSLSHVAGHITLKFYLKIRNTLNIKTVSMPFLKL
jgi:hypothetical protein